MPPEYSVIYATEAATMTEANLATAVICIKKGDLTGALRNVGWAKARLVDLEAEIRGVRFAHGERD